MAGLGQLLLPRESALRQGLGISLLGRCGEAGRGLSSEESGSLEGTSPEDSRQVQCRQVDTNPPDVVRTGTITADVPTVST